MGFLDNLESQALNRIGGSNPMISALLQMIQSQPGGIAGLVQRFQQQTSAAYQAAVSDYQKVADLQPKNATNWLQLGQAAQEAANLTGDTTTAVSAYKHYLKLNPDPATAAQIKQLIKQLQPAPAPAPAAKKKK